MNRLLVAAAFALALIPAASQAGTGPVTATLAAPLAKSADIIVGYSIWRCAESTCTLVSDAGGLDYTSNCRAVFRKAGSVTAFGSADKPMTAERLAVCNKK